MEIIIELENGIKLVVPEVDVNLLTGKQGDIYKSVKNREFEYHILVDGNNEYTNYSNIDEAISAKNGNDELKLYSFFSESKIKAIHEEYECENLYIDSPEYLILIEENIKQDVIKTLENYFIKSGGYKLSTGTNGAIIKSEN